MHSLIVSARPLHSSARSSSFETAGDEREAVAGRPAHEDRKRMDALGAAKLPYPRVLLVVEPGRRFADPFQHAEQALVSPQIDSLVEERLGAGEDDGAVDVILGLDVGEIAGPHRLVLAIAPERIDLALRKLGLHVDAEHRLERAVRARGDDVQDVVEILLHGAGDAQAIECAYDEIGIAQPAEAVIPGAGGSVRLGYGRGDGGHHGAGLFDLAQLERDRRPDHGALPFEWQRKVTDPFPPIVLRPFEELPGKLRDVPLDGVVGTENEVQWPVQQERRLLDHERNRHIGGEPQDVVGQDVTQVIAAARDGRPLGAVVPGRPQPYADMRGSGKRDQPAYQGQGASEAAVPLEARREVLDLERIAGLAAQRRLDDRRFRQVTLLAGGEIVELDLIEADGLDRLQQIAEDRVAVEAGHARPDQARPRVEQARIGAVPDDGEIKRLHP